MTNYYEEASLAYARKLQEEFDRLALSGSADNDYQLALKLQNEFGGAQASSSGWSASSDEELARQLQAEVNAETYKSQALADEEFARQLQEQESSAQSAENWFPPSTSYAAPPTPQADKGKGRQTYAPLTQRPPSPPATPQQPQILPPFMPSPAGASSSESNEDFGEPPPITRPPTPPPGWVEPDRSVDPERNDPAIDDSIALAERLQNEGNVSMVRY